MEQAGSYPADGRLVSGNKRCQGREDHPAQNPCSTLRRMHPFLSQLVDIGFDPAPCGCHRTLCIHIGVRLSLPADGRIVDEPTIQAQPDGGRVQSRKRVFPTGNPVDGKWILSQPADKVSVSGEAQWRMDKCGESIPRNHRAWHTRFGKIIRSGKQLHTPDDFKGIQLLHLRLQVWRFIHNCI